MSTKSHRVGRGFQGRALRIESLENRSLLSAVPGVAEAHASAQASYHPTDVLLCDKAGALWVFAPNSGEAARKIGLLADGLRMVDLAPSGSGSYFGIDAPSSLPPGHDSTSALYEFTVPESGSIVAVKKANLKSALGDRVDLNSLAFDGTSLWAAGSDGTGAAKTYRLYQIDPTTFLTTGQWTLPMSTSGTYQPAGDIEFASRPGGLMGYLTTTAGYLIQFDPTNPSTMQAFRVPRDGDVDLLDLEGLSFGPYSNNMMVALRSSTGQWYRLNNSNPNPSAWQWEEEGWLNGGLNGVLGASNMRTYTTVSAVSVAVSPLSVAEDGTTNLVYTFTRTGVTTGALTVSFTVGGTAAFSTDYTQSGAATFSGTAGTVTFGAGSSTAVVTIDPTADSVVEPDETVVLTVVAGTTYTAGSPSVASGTIANDDTAVSVAVSPLSVAEDGTTNLSYTFTRTGVTTGALTVGFTVGGTAAFSTDYTQSGAATFSGTAGTVTFGAGSSTAVVTIDPTADSVVEPDETVVLTVVAGTTYTAGSPSVASGTIANDDTAVSVAVSPLSVAEDGTTNLSYTFTRTGVTTGALTVSFTVGGTAAFSTDYTQSGAATFSGTAGTVTFGAGSSTAVVTIDPTADSVVEPDETVVLTVVAGTGYAAGTPSVASGTIANDDTAVSVAVSPLSVAEDGTTNLSYTFTRTGVTTGALTVSFTVGGTAAFSTDYAASGAATFSGTAGTVTFAAGSSTALVTIDPTADSVVEPDETVVLTVVAGTGYAAGTPSVASGTIANDDTAVSVSVSVSPLSVAEDGTGNLVYTFTRSGLASGALTVDFSVGGTAAFSTDYAESGAATFSGTAGTVTFAAGSSTAVVTIDATADSTVEPDETVVLTVVAGTGYAAGTPSVASGTILDDDQSVNVSVAVSPLSVAEDGTPNLSYTFTRTGVTAGALTVDFSVGGTAAFSTDYAESGAATFAGTAGTVTFAAGSSTAVVTIDPTADSVVEPDETVVLTVVAGTGYAAGTPSVASGTILDDDQSVSVSVSVSPLSVAEDGTGNLVYTFTRSGLASGALTVDFSVGGTAAFSTDYAESGAATFAGTAGTVTFAAGSSTAVVTIDPTADSVVEPDGTVVLTVVAGTGYAAGTPSVASGAILDDDQSGWADLGLAKQAPTTAIAGQTLTYTITLTNNGATDGRDVQVVDQLPAGVTFVSASGAGFDVAGPSVGGTGDVTFTRATLPVGTYPLTVMVQIGDEPGDGAQLVNRVTVSGSTNDPESTNNTATAGTTVSLKGTALSTSPFDPAKADLIVGGSGDPLVGDSMVVFSDSAGRIYALVGSQISGPFSPTGRIVVYGHAGNDRITIYGKATQQVWAFGGAGNDVIFGGSEDDLIMGGDGNDALYGGLGRNILIGGAESDNLYGRTGENILIGATTDHDHNDAALSALMAEWTRTGDGEAQWKRIRRLRGELSGGLNGNCLLKTSTPATVYDDGVYDMLFGGSQINWYFAKQTTQQRDWLVAMVWGQEMLNVIA